MNNGENIDSTTIIVCLAISGGFLCLYLLYDKNQTARKIGDFLLMLAPGKAKKERILFWTLPPIVVLLFGLLFKYWDYIVR